MAEKSNKKTTRRRSGRQIRDVFASLGEKLGGATSSKEAAMAVLAAADDLFSWDASFVDVYSENEGRLYSIVSIDTVDGKRTEVPFAYEVVPVGSLTRRTLEEGAFLILRDPDQLNDSESMAFGQKSQKSASMMFAPIRKGQENVGVFSIQSYTPYVYSEDDLELLQVLARYCSGALERTFAESKLRRTEEALAKSNERFEILARATNDAVWDWDLETDRVWWSAAIHTLFGYLPEQVGPDIKWRFDAIHPEDRDRVISDLRSTIERGGYSWSAEYRFRTVTGEYTFIYDRAFVIQAEGRPVRVIGSMMNISDRKQAEQALREANANMQIWVSELENRNQEMVVLSEMNDQLQACHTLQEAYAVVSYYAQKLFPGEMGMLCMFNDSRNLIESVAEWGNAVGERAFQADDCWALRRGRVHHVDNAVSGLICRHLDNPLTGEYTCVPMMAQGEAMGTLQFQCLPEQRVENHRAEAARQRLMTTMAEQVVLAIANLKLRETLRFQSIRDPLTGLYNRRYLEAALERELRLATRHERPLGVAMLDLDHFKQFNDTFGHDAGDALLCEVGRYFQANVRAEDIVCRYGGEEFTVILPEMLPEHGLERMDRLRENLKRVSAEYRGRRLGNITISVGMAFFPAHGTTCDALLRQADSALYRAKAEGRNRVVVTTL